MAGTPREWIDASAMALRFTLWSAECSAHVAAGGSEADAPPCPVGQDDPAALVVLAGLLAAQVIGSRRAIGEQLGITGEAELQAYAIDVLRYQLENAEMAASLAAAEAEFSEGAPQGG